MNYLASNSHKSTSSLFYDFFKKNKADFWYNRLRNIFFNEELKLGRVVADETSSMADFSV